MSPSAEDVDKPTHQTCRILPEEPTPAQAWTENETSPFSTPDENRRLLTNLPLPEKSKLEDFVVTDVIKKCKPTKTVKKTGKPKVKTKYQKRKEKIIRLMKPPYFVFSMIFVMICVHYSGLERQLEWTPGAWRKEPWRFITYGLVHASRLHLALNALVATMVGWWLEREQKWWRVAVLWVGGVVGGALGAGAYQPSHRVVGSSAAVYALLMAHLPNVALRYGHIPLWWFRPLSVVVLSTSEGCWTLLRLKVTPADLDADRVAWSAHIVGAVAGVLLGFLVFSGENSSKRSIITCKMSSAVLVSVGLAAATVYYSVYEGT